MNSFRDERVADALDWASSPVVVQAARDGADEARRRGYPDRSIPSVEAEFTGDGLRVLGGDPAVDAFLQSRRTLSPHFAELFLTDAYGYNALLTLLGYVLERLEARVASMVDRS